MFKQGNIEFRVVAKTVDLLFNTAENIETTVTKSLHNQHFLYHILVLNSSVCSWQINQCGLVNKEQCLVKYCMFWFQMTHK